MGKKKFFRTIFSVALVLCMVASMLPKAAVTAKAEDEPLQPYEDTLDENETLANQTAEGEGGDVVDESVPTDLEASEESSESKESEATPVEEESGVTDPALEEGEESLEDSETSIVEDEESVLDESEKEAEEEEEEEKDPFDVEIPTDGSVLIVTMGVNATAVEVSGETTNKTEIAADAQYTIPAATPRKAILTNGFGSVVLMDRNGDELDLESAANVWYTNSGYSIEFGPSVAVAYVTDMMMLSAPTASNTLTFIGAAYTYYNDGTKPAENSAGVFKTNFGNGIGYCGSVGKEIPCGDVPGAYMNLSGMQLVSDANIRKTLYYGFAGPAEWQGYLTTSYSGSGYYAYDSGSGNVVNFLGSQRHGAFYMATHDVLSGYNSGVTRNIAMTTAFKQYLASQPAPPSGFEVYVKRGSGSNQDMFVWSWQPNGSLNLTKASSNTSITNGNKCYDLAGTTYTVYSDPNGKNVVGTLVCKSDGTTNTIDLAPGTYYWKETKAGKGYLLDTSGIHSVTVTAGQTNTIKAKDVPGNDPLIIKISKTNAAGISDYDLSGTQFTIEYFDGYYNTVDDARASGIKRKWVIETKIDKFGDCVAYLRDSYLVTGSDELYKEQGGVTLPLGTIIIEETKAAPGMNNDGVIKDQLGGGGAVPYIAQIKADTIGTVTLVTTNSVKLEQNSQANFGVTDSAIRGDFEFEKTASAYNEKLAGVEFELEEKATGAKWTIVTDANGHYTSATDDNVWSGKEQKAPGLGHLAYGDYVLTELACAANAGYELADPINFTISENNVVLNVGPIDNHKPAITTELTYEGIHMALAKEGIELTDTITYTDFANHKGTELKIHGWLMDAATGNAAVDDNGNIITSDTTATVNNDNGTITLTYKFDGATLGGKTFVSFVSITDEGAADPFVSEEDLTNPDQTIQIPTGGTTATDKNGTHVSLSSEEVTINDVVSYKNLIPGKTYTATGTLMDKDTGAEFLDADGNKVTATTTFTATQPDGEVTVTFKFNATKITTRVVAFETVREERSGVDVFVHADLDDEDQSVDIPKIVTTASDVKGPDEHEALAEKNTMLVDYLDYENLNTNYTYHIVGKLMVSDGTDTGITAEATFTPAQADGRQPVLFAFDATPYAGKTLVVFEKVYVIDENGNEHEIANHEDLNDKKQSVDFPKAETTLLGENGDHTVPASIMVTLIDYVKYTNLQTDGREYTVKGELYDQETGESLGIKGETTFVPTTPDGVVEVEFTFGSSLLQGKRIVAFEDVYDGLKKVATHADIDDEAQEVDIPDVGTKLLAEDTNAHTTGPKKVTLIDYVKYSNLYIGGVDQNGDPIPAKEYTIKGELYDAATGKSLGYTAETTFTPTASSGEVEVRFEVDASDMAGKSFVAFEELWQGDVKLAVHADIEDKNQTVTVPGEMKTTATVGNAKVVMDTAGKTTITDTVQYSNLSAGTYELHAQLMDAQTGKAIEGATGTARFTVDALNPNGQVKVELSFDPANYANHDVVVFEKMYIVTEKDKIIEISKHEDLKDKDQTIRVVHLDQPPKTGENTPIELLLSLLAVSALGIVLIIKKRKSYNVQ